MLLSELVATCQTILEHSGDMPVSISIATSKPEVIKIAGEQKYLVADNLIVNIDEYEKGDLPDHPEHTKELQIRNWPY